jgi:hypothetical protein
VIRFGKISGETMRRLALFLLAGLFAHGANAPRDREAQLADLKRQFPNHTSGEVTDRSDSVTQRYHAKYKQRVAALEVTTLAPAILEIRVDIHNDLRTLTIMVDNPRKTFDAETRAAARRNIIWLQQRMVPYLTKLSQFQRGR